MSSVRSTRTGQLAEIELNRPERGNQFDFAMMRDATQQLRAATDSGADVVVLKGVGPDFSLGRDRESAVPDGVSKREGQAAIVEMNRALLAFPGMTIASVRGQALGFACGLVVQSDFAVAADSATFGFTEIEHGAAPRFVMTYLEDYLGRKRALDLIVTGRIVGAAEAERLGIISQVVADADLETATQTLAASILARKSEAVRACKAYTREIRRMDPDDRLDYALEQSLEARAKAGR